MLSFDEIVEKIVKNSKLTKKEINKLVDAKVEELGGMVSKTGAALVVAREHNVDMEMKAPPKELKINELEPQMGGVSFFAKVLAKYPVNEFRNAKGDGKVQNVLLGDDTGRIRMSFWNDEVLKVEGLKDGDVILVENPWVVSDNRGNPEIRLGRGGSFKKSDKKIEADAKKATLEGIKDGDMVSFAGTVVEVFERALVYSFCPECRERLYGSECSTHGTVAPDEMLIVSCVIDDGTRSINAVFFREVAEKLLSKSVKAIKEELSDGKETSSVTGHIVSKRFKVDGRVKMSKFSGELEIVANDVGVLEAE
ncbi:MAG: DUF2240 family protein [archaeon]